MKILLDPGHGGKDSGAIGKFSKEKDLTLIFSKKIREIILPKAEVFLTREEDKYVTLKERVEEVFRRKVNLFISIHCNSFIKSNPNDSQIYYFNKIKDKPFAELVFSYIDLIDNKHSRWSGIKFGNYYVLRNLNNSIIPAILIELGFISNPRDEELLNDLEYQEKLSTAISKGILAFADIHLE